MKAPLPSHAGSATYALIPAIALAILAGCNTPLTRDSAPSEPVAQPDIKEGDTWRYSIKVDWNGFKSISDVREDHISWVGPSNFALSYASVDGKSTRGAMLLQRDWSTRRQFNHVDSVFTQRFSFPMSPGKSWEVQLSLPYDQTHHSYEVVGWEKVTVPAGTFDALRVEDHGTGVWQHELYPIPVLPMPPGAGGSRTSPSPTERANQVTSSPAGGRISSSYWYVPSIKREVKSIEEEYDATGTLQGRITFQLTSYALH